MANPFITAGARVALAAGNVANMLTGRKPKQDKDKPPNHGKLTLYLMSRGYTAQQAQAILRANDQRSARRVSIEAGRTMRGKPDTGVDGVD